MDINTINENSIIGKIIEKKGIRAGRVMDDIFCVRKNGERTCCPRTSHSLKFAAKLREKENLLPKLLEDLSSLPDI